MIQVIAYVGTYLLINQYPNGLFCAKTSAEDGKNPKSTQPTHHHYLIEYDNAQLVQLCEFFSA